VLTQAGAPTIAATISQGTIARTRAVYDFGQESRLRLVITHPTLATQPIKLKIDTR
jgi:hypothetical protein